MREGDCQASSSDPKEKAIHSAVKRNGCSGIKPASYFPAVLIFSPKNFQVFPSNFARRKVLNVE